MDMNSHEDVAGLSRYYLQEAQVLGTWTYLDPSNLGQDGYGWLYLAVYLFSVVVSFVNLLLSFTGGVPHPNLEGLCCNVGIAIINYPIFDGLYHPFMVIRGLVYHCYTNITNFEELRPVNI